MIRLLWLSLSLTWRERYPRNILFLMDMLTSALDVIFYFFTSEAFGKAFGSQNYFQYVIWGEIATALPVTFMLLPIRSLHSLLIEGSLDIMRTCPRHFWQILLILNYGEISRQLIRIIFILLFAITLGFSINPLLMLKAISLIVISAPLFWSLGILATALFIFSGRGLSAFQQASHVLAVLAGVYFPLHVFPSFVENLTSWFSPMTWLLQSLRSDEIPTSSLILIIVTTPLFVILGLTLLAKSLNHLKRSGKRLLLSM